MSLSEGLMRRAGLRDFSEGKHTGSIAASGVFV
jgi:hypothetical protein